MDRDNYDRHTSIRSNRYRPKEEADVNNDGIVSDDEVDIFDRKQLAQRHMAWVSLVSIIIIAIMLFVVGVFGFIPDARLAIILGEIGMVVIALSGIVGAYMGFSSWLGRK